MLMMCEKINLAVESFFFVAAAAYSQLFCGLLGKYLLDGELQNAHIIRWVFFDYIFQWQSCMQSCMRGSLFTQFLSMAISWRHNSQGRGTTRLRCGGIFNYYFYCEFITESNSEKEFWKSVKIGQSYRHEFGGPVFLEQNQSLKIILCINCSQWRQAASI